MGHFKLLTATLGVVLLVAACGGGGDGNQAPAVKFTSMVSFGDSLSDVGSYRVGDVALAGGGKYTVNSSSAKNWTELIAAQLNLSAPCAAQTGLLGSGFITPSTGTMPTAVNFYSACRNYAQGGARVTNPIGPWNMALAPLIPDYAKLGQLTVPLVTQVSNHLGVVGGTFSGTELVTVMAGGNDALMGAPSAATAEAVTAAVTAMATAGTELANLVNTQMVAKGAKYVAVVNLPDLSKTPYALAKDAASQAVINMMVVAFNNALQTGLSGTAGVRLIDAYTVSRDQSINPGAYGLTNVTTPACNLDLTVNPIGALTCNSATNVISGDISHYMFADSVHPTPFAYQLLAQYVAKELIAAGWL